MARASIASCTLALALTLSSAGCALQGESLEPVGTGASDDDGGETPDAPTPPTPMEGDISGAITSDTVWSGSLRVVANVEIAAGVQVTVEPGAQIQLATGAFVKVAGALAVSGTADAPVVLSPIEVGYGGVEVLPGGSAVLSFVDATGAASLLHCDAGAVRCELTDSQVFNVGKAVDTDADALIARTTINDMANGGVTVRTGATLEIVDSTLFSSTHDIIIVSGGNLIVDYSEIGGAQASYEHCNFHIGAADTVSVTNSNIISSIYGVMIGNSAGPVFRNNNFMENDPGQDVLDLGGSSAVDMSGNYWDQGAPELGPQFDTSGAVATPLAVGPRL